MRNLEFGMLTAVAAAVISIAPLAGQTKSAVPRLADGHPDLQGTYDLATLTPVERTAGSPLVLSDDDIKKGEQTAAARRRGRPSCQTTSTTICIRSCRARTR